MRQFFVTGIGTEIGKTFVSAALLREWSTGGHPVSAVKPLMSGFEIDEITASDAGLLLKAMGEGVTPETISSICLRHFPEPVAPNIALRSRRIDIKDQTLIDFIKPKLLSMANSLSLVEGAGGVMSPLTDTMLNIDLMTALDLPVILVATGYLGAVSHTLSAIEVIKTQGLEIAAIVVTQPTQTSQDPDTLADELIRLGHRSVLAMPYRGDAKALVQALQ